MDIKSKITKYSLYLTKEARLINELNKINNDKSKIKNEIENFIKENCKKEINQVRKYEIVGLNKKDDMEINSIFINDRVLEIKKENNNEFVIKINSNSYLNLITTFDSYYFYNDVLFIFKESRYNLMKDNYIIDAYVYTNIPDFLLNKLRLELIV